MTTSRFPSRETSMPGSSSPLKIVLAEPPNIGQLLDNGVPTGNAVAVSGGTAMLTTAAINVVGTHAITAHYAGDATNTQASSSGALNVTCTGATTFAIQTQPAASNGSPTVKITIN